MKTIIVIKIMVSLLLVVASYAHAANVQPGTAYTAVPKQSGSGFDHYFGFKNANAGIASVEAYMMTFPVLCPADTIFIGFTLYGTSSVTSFAVVVTCKNIANDNITYGGYSSVYGTACPYGSTYLNPYSSPSFTACSQPGINTSKSIGDTEGTGPDNATCSTCRHINIATGNEWTEENDYRSGRKEQNFEFSRFYNSGYLINNPIGAQWTGTYDRNLLISTNSTYQYVTASRRDGKKYTYTLTGGNWINDTDVNDILAQTSAGWIITTASNEVENYDYSGKLTSISKPGGYTQTLSYNSNGMLTQVIDSTGRALSFLYDSINRITQMTSPDSSITHYAYDANNNLTSVIYPDNSIKQYRYGETGYVSLSPVAGVVNTTLLTGIIDQNGTRYASYWYDSHGRAYKEEFAPGLNQGIGKNVLSFVQDGNSTPITSTLTDPLTAARTYSYANLINVPKTTGQTQPAGSGSAAASSALTYDANGNITSRKDFNGNKNCYSFDLTRNLELYRVEGLAPGVACPSNLATYVPPAGGIIRKVSTQWSTTYRLPAAIAEPLRITTNTYDTSGNLMSSSIQPTTDVSGGAGFSGTPVGLPRNYAYTYNAIGQVLTVDGPRTDLSDVTTFLYDANYNLVSATNALGQETTYDIYDANGRVGEITDPNGLTTDLTYDLMGRLTGINRGGENTTYAYDGAGNLTSVTLPGGASYTYTYDPANRLTRITDNLGNYVSYTLDANGNRAQQQVFDSTSTLVETHSSTFDILSRLYHDVGAVNQTTVFAYDANGNLKTETDPLNRVNTNSYDALNRLIANINPASGITQLGYDDLDQLTKVTDPRTLITQYTKDGLGNMSLQASPDTGSTGLTYDAAGNALTRTDAASNMGTFTYDALNRVTSATYTNGAATPIAITYTYDHGTNGIEHLTGITEPTGLNNYSYDLHGRMITEQRIAHGQTYTTSYGYDTSGRLSSLTYPSGRVINYSFDAMGRISEVDSAVGGVTTPVASTIIYTAFGTVSGFNYGDGTTSPVQGYARQYDQDGRISSYTLNGVAVPVGYDAASQITWLNTTAIYGYDALSRLTSYVQGGTSQSYGYDADGNRTTQTLSGTGTTYTFPSTSNHLTGIVSGGITVPVTQDANGSTNNDTARQYTYDLRGRLIQAVSALGTANYEVDARGLRVRKQAGGTDTLYFYDQQGHVISEAATGTTSFGTEYVYLGDMPVAVFNGAALDYIHTEHLNTPRMITDTSQNVVWTWANTDPFGANAASGSLTFNLRFPGQYYDAETRLNYNVNRDYDPVNGGRYLQSDPVGLIGGVNGYGYVGGNPISYIDPIGLKCNASGCWLTPNEKSLADAGNYIDYYDAACTGGDSYACAAKDVAGNVGFAANFTNWRLRRSLKENGTPENQCNAKMEGIRKDLAHAHASALAGGSPDKPIVLTADQISNFHHDIFTRDGAGSVFGGDIPGSNLIFNWCSSPSCRP